MTDLERNRIVVNLSHNIIAWLDPAVGDKATYGEIIAILGRAFALAVQDYMTVYIATHYVPKKEREDGTERVGRLQRTAPGRGGSRDESGADTGPNDD